TVAPGNDFFGGTAQLPAESVAMISRIGPVLSASATGRLDAKVYRSDRIPAIESGGISVQAARTDLPATVGAAGRSGARLKLATAQYPAVVLGARTAARLGITAPGPNIQVYLGGRWFTVIGILDPVPLAPELDLAALIGWDAARTYLGFNGYPTTVYTRARQD